MRTAESTPGKYRPGTRFLISLAGAVCLGAACAWTAHWIGYWAIGLLVVVSIIWSLVMATWVMR